jgi:hypothetical protein
MSSRFEYFTGPCKWAMLDKMDEEYRNYKINIYLDKANLKKFTESGINIKLHEDDEGKYVIFKRNVDRLLEGMPEKPKKLLHDGDGNYSEFNGLIGNGSTVTAKVQVYNGKKGVGHRLEAVAIEKLIPYGDQQDDSELPF